MNEQEQQKKATEMIKSVYEDGFAEINGRRYDFNKTTHKKRRQVFAFYTSIQQQVAQGDFSFMDSESWDRIEGVIGDIVAFQGDLLSRLTDHWEQYPEDYLMFTQTALAVISYPFMRGGSTG